MMVITTMNAIMEVKTKFSMSGFKTRFPTLREAEHAPRRRHILAEEAPKSVVRKEFV